MQEERDIFGVFRKNDPRHKLYVYFNPFYIPEASKLTDRDIKALDIPLGRPRRDHARMRVLEAVGNALKEKRRLERRGRRAGQRMGTSPGC